MWAKLRLHRPWYWPLFWLFLLSSMWLSTPQLHAQVSPSQSSVAPVNSPIPQTSQQTPPQDKLLSDSLLLVSRLQARKLQIVTLAQQLFEAKQQATQAQNSYNQAEADFQQAQFNYQEASMQLGKAQIQLDNSRLELTVTSNSLSASLLKLNIAQQDRAKAEAALKAERSTTDGVIAGLQRQVTQTRIVVAVLAVVAGYFAGHSAHWW